MSFPIVALAMKTYCRSCSNQHFLIRIYGRCRKLPRDGELWCFHWYNSCKVCNSRIPSKWVGTIRSYCFELNPLFYLQQADNFNQSMYKNSNEQNSASTTFCLIKKIFFYSKGASQIKISKETLERGVFKWHCERIKNCLNSCAINHFIMQIWNFQDIFLLLRDCP